MNEKTWFQKIRIIGWPETPKALDKIFQPLMGEEFLAFPIKGIKLIGDAPRQLAEILKELGCPATIDAAVDDIFKEYFKGLTGKTGYIINTSTIMHRLDCKAPASSHWLRKYRSPQQPWWHFPEGSYEIIDESKDPDQADWGTGETRQMSEEEKQEIREQGLAGESSR